MRRHSVGIEIIPEYYKMVKKQIKPVSLYLLEPQTNYGKKSKIKSKGRISVR